MYLQKIAATRITRARNLSCMTPRCMRNIIRRQPSVAFLGSGENLAPDSGSQQSGIRLFSCPAFAPRIECPVTSVEFVESNGLLTSVYCSSLFLLLYSFSFDCKKLTHFWSEVAWNGGRGYSGGGSRYVYERKWGIGRKQIRWFLATEKNKKPWKNN